MTTIVQVGHKLRWHARYRVPELLALAAFAAFSTFYVTGLWRHAHYSNVFTLSPACIIAVMLRTKDAGFRLRALAVGLAGIFGGLVVSGLDPFVGLALTLSVGSNIGLAVAATKHFGSRTLNLSNRRDLIIYLACVGVLGPIVGSALNAFNLSNAGLVDYWTAFMRSYLSQATGILVVGLFAQSITRADLVKLFMPRPLETIMVLGSLTIVTFGVFIQSSYPLLFLIFPMLTLTMFRLRFGGSAIGTLLVSVIATLLTVYGHGPINLIHGSTSTEVHIHFLQLFLAIVVLTTVPMSTILRDRDFLKAKTVEDENRIWMGEELYRQIERHTTSGLVLLSLDSRWLRVNPIVLSQLGYTEDEFIGKHVNDFTHPDDIEKSTYLRNQLVDGLISTYQVEKRYLCYDGTPLWFNLSVALVRDAQNRPQHFVAQIVNINDQKLAATQLIEAKHNAELAYSIQHAESQRRQFINGAGRLMQNPTDIHATLDRVAKHAVTRLGDVCLIVIFPAEAEHNTAVLGLAAKSSDVLNDNAARQLRRKTQGDLIEIFDLQRLMNEQLSIFDHQTVSAYFRSSLYVNAVPIFTQQNLSGMIVVGQTSTDIFTQDNRMLLQELAGRLSILIDVARLFERERRLAQELQEAMLPSTLPNLLEASIDAQYVPASAESDVGGDWYDAFTLPDGRIFISVGDVAGHGLSAAGAMGKIRQMIRAYALVDPDPVSIARRCDQAIAFLELPTSTAIFGIYDTVLGSFIFVQAGHPSPILIAADGTVEMLSDAPRTLPLGLIDDCPIEQATITIPPGARFIAYTDGLIEYERDVIIGERQLLTAVAQLASDGFDLHPAQAIVRAVFGEQIPRDDVAILVLTVPAATKSSLSLNAKATPLNLRILRQRISAFAAQRGLYGPTLQRLEIAVGEALTNVLEHAYHFESGEIMVFGSGSDMQVSIEIADHGKWRREREEGRGYGLAVMKEFCDNVEVFHDHLGTRVRLTQGVNA